MIHVVFQTTKLTCRIKCNVEAIKLGNVPEQLASNYALCELRKMSRLFERYRLSLLLHIRKCERRRQRFQRSQFWTHV